MIPNQVGGGLLKELREARELIASAIQDRERGDNISFLESIKKSMILSFEACLSKLGISSGSGYDNVLKLYLMIPHMYRPSIGEPELEDFEFRYNLIVSNEMGAIYADERFLDASQDLAERVYFWAEALLEKL